MMSFVTTVVALNYLNATNMLTDKRKESAEKALNKGIATMLEARITSGPKNGSFSIWKKNHWKQ